MLELAGVGCRMWKLAGKDLMFFRACCMSQLSPRESHVSPWMWLVSECLALPSLLDKIVQRIRENSCSLYES